MCLRKFSNLHNGFITFRGIDQYTGFFTCLCVARRQGGGTDKLFFAPSPFSPPIKGGEKEREFPIKRGEREEAISIEGGERKRDSPIKGLEFTHLKWEGTIFL